MSLILQRNSLHDILHFTYKALFRQEQQTMCPWALLSGPNQASNSWRPTRLKHQPMVLQTSNILECNCVAVWRGLGWSTSMFISNAISPFGAPPFLYAYQLNPVQSNCRARHKTGFAASDTEIAALMGRRHAQGVNCSASLPPEC
jgi:hypothetical protein